MERSDSESLCVMTVDEKPLSPTHVADAVPRAPNVFLFNPFAEAYIAEGNGFTPVKHQAMLAEDLANLPQFLAQPGDIVLSPKTPSTDFIESLKRAGFAPPKFVQLSDGRLEDITFLPQHTLGSLRPWAWGPDSVKVLEPLFALLSDRAQTARQCFNDNIARLYSKAWSATFLRKVMAGWDESQSDTTCTQQWLCTNREVGVAVDTVEDALSAIGAIRSSGHHRVVVKQTHGLAGHNSIRLWEPEMLPAQQRWLAHAVDSGRQLVVEPWLERQFDFSVQLEMEPCGLRPCGYTGLVNDRKGQFLANWAEPDFNHALPGRITALLGDHAGIASQLSRLYAQIFSMLQTELQRLRFLGPVSIDALLYRTPQGESRLKPVVEINPRYTMGRLTLELMKQVCRGCSGLFRIVTRGQARAEGFPDLSSYASSFRKRVALRLTSEPLPQIRQGTLCLNDPSEAQVCLATFEVAPNSNLPASSQRFD